MSEPRHDGDAAISVSGLRKSFKNLKVLTGIDFTVKRGTILALLGPNGAGKTTTVRILSTLLKPDHGNVLVNGFDVVKQPDKVRRSIGLTGQYAAVDEYLSGLENLIMMGRLYHLTVEESKQRAHQLLKEFDLVDAASRRVKEYSGGMRRRLDLAMSLIADPPIIFLDEPTTGLDPRSRLSLWSTIKTLAQSGRTILLTTQYMDEADHLADRIIVIDHGRVIAQGTANELKQKVGSERLAITLAHERDIAIAHKVLDGKVISTDPARRMLVLTAQDGVAVVKHALKVLESHSIEVESLSLHKPTLDDVFLSLTGHAASKGDQEKNEVSP